MRFCLTLVLSCLFIFSALAQQTTPAFPAIGIGDWAQHLPWQRSYSVAQSKDKVYFSTEWAVVEIDKKERSPKFLTKVEGLSDVGVRMVRYNKTTETLLIVYNNSNLDLYHPADGRVENLPFIRKNTNLGGDKSIYDISFDGKFAYLACGFGALKLNLERAEVVYTVFTGVPVKSFGVFQSQLYAGTDEGIYRLPADDINPADFSRWNLLGATQGFPGGKACAALAVWNNKLYCGLEKTLYEYDGSTLKEIRTNPDRPVFYLTGEGNGLVIAWKSGFNGDIEYMEPNGNRSTIHWACDAGKPLYAIEDGTKKFWIADDSDDFRYFDLETGTCDRFKYDSPFLHLSSEIDIAPDGKVLVATAGAASNLSPLGAYFGLFIYKDGQWTRLSRESNPELDKDDCSKDFWRVAAHPSEDKFYVGSFVGGLIEGTAAGAPTKCYNQYNSKLQSAGASGASRTAIGGMAFDADKNLWICNYDAAAPIAVLKPDGTIRNFSSAPANNLLQVAIDQNGYKWFVVGFNGGVMVYDSGADLDNPADDRYRLLTTSNSELKTNTVNTIGVDLEGDVWVGTQQGVVTFECGSNIFDASCTGRRRIVNVDDFNAYLLETEDVRCIAVDGANRKWFGTTNGIFVQSADGITQVARYTTTNSPLFDDGITDIAINPKTGEVWIGTDKGLQSLRGEAVSGGKVNSLTPYAYPNPVRSDYDGPIAIYGLARDANVKITDVAGNLVYEGQALGGQAVWNGRDYLGRRVATGVYLVYATSVENFESPDAVITKVVVIH